MVDIFLDQLKAGYKNILKDNLVGIYLHGSIVFDCFNPESSDIDFIVVINDKMNHDIQKQLINKLTELEGFAPQKGFEMSVVLKKHCLDFTYPTPYELHFSNDCLNDYSNNDYKTDKDLAAHFTIIKACGQVLYGQPISDVFGDVKNEYYVDSIYYDIENAEKDIIEYPTYIVLNLCRVLAYLKDGKILSKRQGGLWGLAHLPETYKAIIENALKDYVDNIKIELSEKEKIDFATHMINGIKNYF